MSSPSCQPGAANLFVTNCPLFMRDGLTLVVSPLIALMRDQVAQLRGMGVAAASLNSSNTSQENAQIYQYAIEGDLKLLYISPERLARTDTIEFLKKIQVAAIAVDEAHCVSQWGHDFRPEYQQIGHVCAALGGVQVLGFTATADAQTRVDIEERLFPSPPQTFLHGFDRPNIRLAMTPRNNAKSQLLNFLKDHQNQSGIVYCQSRKKVDETARFLSENGLNAHPYHAGMDAQDRASNQDRFLREDGIIIVATIAFGMGIDKPDVRFVFHMDLPKNIESYYQEIGRAGRDNLPADTLTLHGYNEIRQYRQWIDQSDAADEQKRIEHQKLNSLAALCEASVCRRQTLLAYFGDECEPCANCDLCAGEIETREGTLEAQMALSNMLRTKEMFGIEHLVSVLRGSENQKILKFNHQDLSTYGIGKDISTNQWRSTYRQLLALGLVSIDAERFNRWVVTQAGWDVLKNNSKVQLRVITPDPVAKHTRPKRSKVDIGNANQQVLASLKARRLEIAQEKNQPAYVIFTDKSLIDMANKLPITLEQMAEIHGVGEKKLAQYGKEFLALIEQSTKLTSFIKLAVHFYLSEPVSDWKSSFPKKVRDFY